MKSLCTLNELLPEARKQHYAVPGFDCVSDIYIRAILDAAEMELSPVILMAVGHDLAGRSMNYLAGLVHAVAPHYRIPIALHLDHAQDMDLIKRAIDNGFTSVMFDGSNLAYHENLVATHAVMELARPYGVSVEAELGCVAGTEITGTDLGENILTEPEEVREFVKITKVDALAVSIGTTHGVYKSTPTLDIDRLKAINAVSPVPLVMHGGSGTPEDQVQAAIRNGITKFNVYADTRLAINGAFRKSAALIAKRPDELPDVVFKPLHDAIVENTRAKIRIAMSGGKAGPKREGSVRDPQMAPMTLSSKPGRLSSACSVSSV